MAEKKLKILLVDDDEMIRIYFHDVLWIHGFEKKCDLMIATDLDQAEKITNNPETQPDVIFLDLGLPKKVGDRTLIDPKYSFEFLRHIKKEAQLKKIKVMIFSGHADPEYLDEAKKCGADGYIQKAESLPRDLVSVMEDIFKKVA